MKSINITSEAADRKTGMTLDELYEFVREAMASGFPTDTVIGATVGFRGQLQKATIAGQVADPGARTVDLDPRWIPGGGND